MRPLFEHYFWPSRFQESQSRCIKVTWPACHGVYLGAGWKEQLNKTRVLLVSINNSGIGHKDNCWWINIYIQNTMDMKWNTHQPDFLCRILGDSQQWAMPCSLKGCWHRGRGIATMYLQNIQAGASTWSWMSLGQVHVWHGIVPTSST